MALVMVGAAVLALLVILPAGIQQALRSAPRWLFGYLAAQPFILLFLVVACGYVIARAKVKGLSLGATAGTLLVALCLSWWASGAYGIQFKLSEFAGTLFFNLFMFSVGMKVGPQFLVGLHRGAKDLVLLAVFVPLLAGGLMLVLRVLLHLPVGMTAGIFAGANTATPGLGAAQAAYASGATSVDVALASSNLSTAFAFSYCISMVLFIVMLKALPRLFGRDPVGDARAFEHAVSPDATALPGTADSLLPGAPPVARRTYRLERPEAVGKSLRELRELAPLLDVQSVIRGGECIPLSDETTLQRGDEVAVFGTVERLLRAADRIGGEVNDPRVPALHLQTVDVVQRNDAVVGKALRELAGNLGHGLYLNAMFRAGEHIPHSPNVRIRKGDVLRVTGSPESLATLAERVGPVVRRSLATDVFTLALGLCAGAALGSIVLPVGRIELSLGSVALLLTGIAVSTLRTRNPAFGGPFPEPARQLLEDLGLNLFVGVLGLNAGAGVSKAVQSGAMLPVLVGALVIGLVPAIVAWALGQYRLKMNAAELMGAVAGARCNSAAMRAAQETCESTVPAIAYPVTFAISNVLLTIGCYFMALLG